MQQSCNVPLQAGDGGRAAYTQALGSKGQEVKGSCGQGLRALTIAGLGLLVFRVGKGELVSVAAHPHRRAAGRVERGPRAAHGAVTAARGSGGKNQQGQKGAGKIKNNRMSEN